MDFPKTIPIPEISMRLKEFELLGYEVQEVEHDQYLVFKCIGEGIRKIIVVCAGYRKKRNKKFYFDRRMLNPDLHTMAKLSGRDFRDYSAKEIWWNSRRG